MSSVLPAVDKSPCWLGNKSDEPWAVADFIAKLARVLSDDRQLEQRPMRVRARARARAARRGKSAVHITNAPMLAWYLTSAVTGWISELTWA